MSKITKEFLEKALKTYEKYKGDKELLNERVKENDFWYRARYQKVINPSNNEAQPSTAFLFSAIENKFADAVDSFPVPNILQREPSDTEISEVLSKIIPVELDLADFKKAYKINWRRKLKHGTGIYGIFYNGNNIVIKSISILNIYCDMYMQDIQDSPFLFIVNAVANNELKKNYKNFNRLFSGNTTIETFDGSHEIPDKTEIIDCYYKKDGFVHCMKICNNEVISATEDENYNTGLYKHGLYPVVFDVFFPQDDCPFGFGIIDVAKNPQIYIDKLDGAIIKNSILSSKTRFMIKDNGAVNEEEVINCDNDIIHVAGGVDSDSIRELQVSNVSELVLNHRIRKIDELKEIIGNRDFQQGSTSGGVTAASAITLLQETGNKLSRSMIDDSYDAYKKIVLMTIELIREFFDEKKVFRITGGNKEYEYIGLSKKDLFRTNKNSSNNLPKTWNDGVPIEFDVEVVPQKKNPYSREANNSTIIELFKNGMFDTDKIDSSIIALGAMCFEGKEKIISSLKDLKKKNIQLQKINSGELLPINNSTISSVSNL